MRTLLMLCLAALACWTPRALAFGIDIGPVKIHGTKVKIGEDITLRMTVDKIEHAEKKEGEETAKIARIKSHRKGDGTDNFDIKVDYADLDEDSREYIPRVREEKTYSMKVKKTDEGWKLLKVRPDDD
ncbi:MAG: hypothetical protein M5U26_08165 [Planctomycetota bacterium]|nr:hypothetical protein [Planctomycetota bacterium]